MVFGRPKKRALRIYFATDIHGSDRCFRKFLAAAESYEADALVLGGDIAGFPNGRRVFDDIVAVELRAIAGVTIPLVDPGFTPDAAAGVINDFSPPAIPNGVRFEKQFPFLGLPFDGYDSQPHPNA